MWSQRRVILGVVVVLAMGLSSGGATGAELNLARDGNALVSIVLAPDASKSLQAVAQDLADTLGQMTGTTFTITRAAEANPQQGILLGTLAQFPDESLQKPLAIRDTFDGREAFAIRTDGQRLRLIGATDLGASHAAYRFLHTQGCRWFFPNPDWNVIPRTPTLNVSVNLDDRPAMLSRRIWYQWGHFDSQVTRDYETWSRRNLMASSLRVATGHAHDSIARQYKDQFDAHPEYWALVSDAKTGQPSRRGPQLCLANPQVQEMVRAYARKHFDYYKDRVDMISVDPADGGGHCECDACAKLGTVSDRVFGLANLVARMLQKEYPTKMVGVLAYNYHTEPPSFDLEPNVYVQPTAGFHRGKYTWDQLKVMWSKKARYFGFYDYFSVYEWNRDTLPGGRGADVPYLTRTIREYAALGASSLDAESGNNWALHGRGYLVANALMWNPGTDVDVLLADFYDKAFGPAAPAMRRYYERLDPGNKPLLGTNLVAAALRDVDEACRLAKDRSDVLARLRDMKLFLRYVDLRWRFDNTADKEARKSLALAILTHGYRTRHRYMNHWAPLQNLQSWRWVKEFDEWSWHTTKNPVPQPWKVAEPVSDAELDEAWRQMLSYFTPENLQEVQFSGIVLPVAFPPHPRTYATRHNFQSGIYYLLYSESGEPLKFSIVSGTIGTYLDNPDATWSILDAAEQTVLAEGSLPLDTKQHDLEIPVPRAGLYVLRHRASSAGFRVFADAGVVATIPLARDRRLSQGSTMGNLFFYVPKGTQEIIYHAHTGPHTVRRLDGSVALEVPRGTGNLVRVPVPPGTDGQCWYFDKLVLGQIWFYNVPNYVAVSPASLLVPLDVIERDGLMVRGSGPRDQGDALLRPDGW